MGVREYYLYRVKFIKPAQMSLLGRNLTSASLFLSSIDDKPEFMLAKGGEWHLGNIEHYEEGTGSFAVGRTTKTTVERFDKASGNFIDHLDDSSPYTVIVFDSKIGLLGITKKSKLASDAATVARRVRDLLQKTNSAIDSGVEVRVDYIPDPEGFLAKLRSSYAIKKFKASFTGPNPIDADELFQRPLSVYAQAIGGQSGSLEVVGDALNEDVAEAIAKSTAATGNTASARVIPEKGGKSKLIKMKGVAAVVAVDDDASYPDVILQIKSVYESIRR